MDGVAVLRLWHRRCHRACWTAFALQVRVRPEQPGGHAWLLSFAATRPRAQTRDHVGMHLGKFSATALAAAALAALSAALAPADADAHLRLRSFTITPSCGSPGSVIRHRVTVRQSHPHHVHVLWARVTVRHALTGLVVQRRDQGPRRVPFGTHTSRGRSTIPENAPLGDYQITLRLGSRRGGAQYGVSTRTLRVLPLGLRPA